MIVLMKKNKLLTINQRKFKKQGAFRLSNHRLFRKWKEAIVALTRNSLVWNVASIFFFLRKGFFVAIVTLKLKQNDRKSLVAAPLNSYVTTHFVWLWVKYAHCIRRSLKENKNIGNRFCGSYLLSNSEKMKTKLKQYKSCWDWRWNEWRFFGW